MALKNADLLGKCASRRGASEDCRRGRTAVRGGLEPLVGSVTFPYTGVVCAELGTERSGFRLNGEETFTDGVTEPEDVNEPLES